MNLIVDAVQVIREVFRNPESSSERKRKHFANVAISEVYLEATPTVFLTIMLLTHVVEHTQDTKALEAFIGIDFDSESDAEISRDSIFFFVTFTSSVLSASFGIARYVSIFILKTF